MQTTLMTLGLLMSTSGSVRNAVAQLVSLCARSRTTISQHLGMAQAEGWLTCVERGGYRSEGPAPSVYQASVPVDVYERRGEFLAALAPEESDQGDLATFPPGTVIAGQDHHGPTSRFSSEKINQSILHREKQTSSACSSGTPEAGTDPVIAAVIEELAALTGHMVSSSWAARVVSQIVRHRRVRHPIAYIVKSLQNAAEDGTLKARFMPPVEETLGGVSTESAPAPTAEPARGLEPEAEPPAPSWPLDEPVERSGLPADELTGSAELTGPAQTAEPVQGVYRPGGRLLSGLGARGALELARVREQFAQRRDAHTQAATARGMSVSASLVGAGEVGGVQL
ncbi:hypothetical protein MRI28_18740 [Nocardiopsis dassonvillei]|uniref:hypothetical protein n=1 Tax=Nocardiopsis dassonvillei TaxID=2014 RepID=UPI00200F6232|nr:hypothetical protein [Nocardiopsis dassonvillei]MCK9871649.1 hypothetical protein [Nocardiopsis dassonvillei]